jgi:hypothetical protein
MVIDVAASDQDGSITLNVSPTVGWSTVVEGSHHRDITPVQVRAARLDTLARAGRLRRPIALMKLDAEGHEAAVLDGAAELVSEDRPYLLIELNRLMLEPAGETPASVLERVVRNDRYDVFELRAPRGLLSGRRFELFSLADWHAVEFMDVLCVPRERGLPQQ